MRDRRAGGPVTGLQRLRAIGWGGALIPVTASYLAIFGAFSLYTQSGSANLFSATTLPGSVFWSVLLLTAVTLYTVAAPRRAGYLAAVGLTGLGAWVLFEAVAFHHYTYDWEWYGWLRDQLYIEELGLLGVACLGGGFMLTRRTIVADVRARRHGLTAQVERLTRTRAEAVDSAAAELRRLERDLHDGAQARLVALGINLRNAGILRPRPCPSCVTWCAASTRRCSPTGDWATRSRRSRSIARSAR